MYYQEDENKQGKFLAWLITGLYAVLWVVLIIVINFDFETKDEEGGILIDFGDSELALGTTDLTHTEPVIEQVIASPEVEQVEESIAVQDFEPAPEITPTDEVETKEVAPEPPKVNKKALFPGSTIKSQSQSQGEEKGTGNQGSEKGAAEGEQTGTGQDSSGSMVDLRGRNLISELPKPEYNAEEYGQVIIRITVSPNGAVSSAEFQSSGSTTQNLELVNAALIAARKAKFNPIDALTPQSGTITYNFKLR